MATKPDIQQEEVDLGTLFGQIGKMFSNFFNFIGNIFKALYHYFIILVLFIRKHVLILGGATLVGMLVGLLFIEGEPMRFTSEMAVEVAPSSGDRLYNQVSYLNTLLGRGQSQSITEIFDLSKEEARSIRSFKVEPFELKINTYKAYDKYMHFTDTIYTRGFEYSDFMKRLTSFDLTSHLIMAEGYNPDVFPKLANGFVFLMENEYYKNLVENKKKDLLFEKKIIENNISQIDSLRKRYKETAYLQFAQKDESNSGVSFRTINAGYKGNVDVDLYRQTDSLVTRLRKVNQLITDNEGVLKIKSNFTVGKVDRNIFYKPWVLYGFMGFGVAFLILLVINFNKYLNRYEEKV